MKRKVKWYCSGGSQAAPGKPKEMSANLPLTASGKSTDMKSLVTAAFLFDPLQVLGIAAGQGPKNHARAFVTVEFFDFADDGFGIGGSGFDQQPAFVRFFHLALPTINGMHPIQDIDACGQAAFDQRLADSQGFFAIPVVM